MLKYSMDKHRIPYLENIHLAFKPWPLLQFSQGSPSTVRICKAMHYKGSYDILGIIESFEKSHKCNGPVL